MTISWQFVRRACAALAGALLVVAVASPAVAAAAAPGTTPTPGPAIRLRPPAAPQPHGPAPVNQTDGALSQLYIAPPTQLQNTGDPSVCADHGGLGAALACGAAFQQGWLVLIWNWQAPGSYTDPANPLVQYTVVKDIDGFHADEVAPGGTHQLVSTASLGGAGTVTMFNPPSSTSAQRCYVVRAFKGQLESSDSSPFCIGNGAQPTTTTVSLTPSSARTIRHEHRTPFDLPSCGLPNFSLVVGYVHCNDGPDQLQEVSRALVKFDLSTLGPVFKATLKFHRESTSITGTDPLDNNQVSTFPADEPLHGRTDANCASEVLLPTYDWVAMGWNDSDPTAAPPVTDFPTVDFAPLPLFASDPTFDVTDLVTQWRQQPWNNNGFALRGGDEYTSEEDNNACLSVYSSFVLEVTHLPSGRGAGALIDPGTIGIPAGN